jgi:hypothetical protein
MDHVLNVLPVWLAFTLFAAVPAAVAVLLHDRFRRFVPAERLIPHHEVAGFLVSVVGLFFAVVLGFLVAAAWTAFDTAQRTADAEASNVAATFAAADVLPEPTRSRLRSLMANYAFEVRDNEWKTLAHGAQDLQARRYLVDAFKTVARSQIPAGTSLPEALELQSSQQLVLQTLHDLTTQRRMRLLDAGRRIPNALYMALFMGWVILMAFVFLFGCSRLLQLTMTALVAAMVGLLMGLIAEFDLPYSHGIRVSNDAWTFVINNNQLATYRTPQAAP